MAELESSEHLLAAQPLLPDSFRAMIEPVDHKTIARTHCTTSSAQVAALSHRALAEPHRIDYSELEAGLMAHYARSFVAV